MGDRAVTYVIGAPCAAYVHWSGESAFADLIEAAPLMRRGDADYATARLIGVLHQKTIEQAPTGLGVLPAPTKEDVADGFQKFSQGDAGVLIVDIDRREVKLYAGYLAEEKGPGPFPIPDCEE